ncbi:hypothetical protein D3C76_1346150 [compost metagenome]
MLVGVACGFTFDSVSGTAGTVAAGAAALCYKTGYDTVKGQSVIKAFIGQFFEIGDSVGGMLRIKLQINLAAALQCDGTFFHDESPL